MTVRWRVNIDATGIQFRVLNMKKGPAVRSTRIQADKTKYALRMKKRLEEQENLFVRQGMVEKLLVEGMLSAVLKQLGRALFLHNRYYHNRDISAWSYPRWS